MMTTHATATFTVKRWAQKTWDGRPAHEVTGSKLTLDYDFEDSFVSA